ncbi:unnamed protein product [Rhizophagus irregularis]|nr:unnamed protein product [Rhizophagus irregularis]
MLKIIIMIVINTEFSESVHYKHGDETLNKFPKPETNFGYPNPNSASSRFFEQGDELVKGHCVTISGFWVRFAKINIIEQTTNCGINNSKATNHISRKCCNMSNVRI